MELRQLEHFVVVAEQGSISRAATQLHLVQSSLSASILALERRLGTTLLHRGARGTTPTAAGLVLLPLAREILDGVAAARDAVAAVAVDAAAAVRVATVPLAPPLDLMSAIGVFRRQHPTSRVQVTQTGSDAVRAAVLDGSCDWGVGPPGEEADADFTSLLRTPLVLLVAEDHPLADKDLVEPSDLGGGQMIHLPKSWRIRELMEDWCVAPGVDRPATIQVDDWPSLHTLVSLGVGAGYGTRGFFASSAQPGVRLVELRDPPFLEVGVITRHGRTRSPAAQTLLDVFLSRSTTVG